MLKAFHRTMLPKRYKDLPMLGRGATSMVFDLGEDVDILTMDSIKVEFLSSSEYCKDSYEYIDDMRSHPQDSRFDDMSVYSIKMKKLQKNTFSSESRKECRFLHKELERIKKDIENELRSDYIHSNPRNDLNSFNQAVMQRVMDESEENDRLLPLAEMADNISSFWGGDTYIFDLSPRNMLWDEDKKEVFVNDAVVPLDIYEIINTDSYKYLKQSNVKAFNEKKEVFNRKMRERSTSLGQPSI